MNHKTMGMDMMLTRAGRKAAQYQDNHVISTPRSPAKVAAKVGAYLSLRALGWITVVGLGNGEHQGADRAAGAGRARRHGRGKTVVGEANGIGKAQGRSAQFLDEEIAYAPAKACLGKAAGDEEGHDDEPHAVAAKAAQGLIDGQGTGCGAQCHGQHDNGSKGHGLDQKAHDGAHKDGKDLPALLWHHLRSRTKPQAEKHCQDHERRLDLQLEIHCRLFCHSDLVLDILLDIFSLPMFLHCFLVRGFLFAPLGRNFPWQGRRATGIHLPCRSPMHVPWRAPCFLLPGCPPHA